MKCPNCGVTMESEDCSLALDVGVRDLMFQGKYYDNKPRRLPSVHYYCDGCDSEWSWTKGIRGLLFIDGARGIDEMRTERRLLPIDSHSQLDTGFTGRSDADGRMQDERHKPPRGFLA